MKTVLTESPIEAAEYIKKGGIVAFPTETVYGLGANVFDEKAIAGIFEAKQRPNDNPLISHVGDLSQIKSLVKEVTENARKFIEAFFPAPLTLVLPKAESVPLIATANLDTIGVRMPGNELAREFLKHCETPLVAPSANLSGKPSPTDWRAVYEDLNGRIDCILQSEATEIGLESTVVDCTGDVPLVLRSGAVTLEDLQEIVPETRIYQIRENEIVRSPGLKHKHYAPSAKVVLVDSGFKIQDSKFSIQDSGFRIQDSKFKNQDSRLATQDVGKNAFIGLTPQKEKFDLTKICGSVEEYAREVFAFFRRCDAENVETIYCETIAETGIGLALMDRLKRAAEN